MRAWLILVLTGCTAIYPLDPSNRSAGVGDLPVPGVPDPVDPPPPPPEPADCGDIVGSAEMAKACAPGVVAMVADQPFDDLQDAVDAAPDGSTVWICPGNYDDDTIELVDRTLTIEAVEYNDVYLDGDREDRLFDIRGSGAVTLRGFEIQFGRSVTSGGGIRNRGTDLTLHCMRFDDNFADLNGGAVHSSDASLTVEATEFRRNLANTGGAVRVNTPSDRQTRFVRTSFDDNVATTQGGALAIGSIDADPVTIEDCEFDDNQAGGRGGAIAAAGSATPTLTIMRTQFEDNSANAAGGAISLDHGGPADVTLISSELRRNAAQHASALGVGERVEGGTVAFIDTVFFDNVASDPQGAAIQSPGATGLIFTQCDLGDGGRDNAPNDIVFGNDTYNEEGPVDLVLVEDGTAPGP